MVKRNQNPSFKHIHDTALTRVKEWLLFKIQDLTLDKSCSLVGVLQTLFLDQKPNQLGSL
jgi:hypothetical protein